jgi:hypothetical protein
MSGADVLDEVAEFVTRFVRMPSPAAVVAVVLWVAHAHAIEVAESTPYLGIGSPEKRSGKTRLLEVLALLVPRCLRTSGMSEAALFRVIAEEPPPTLLIDEIDTVFTPRPRPETEGLRGVLDSGHRRGAQWIRATKVGAVERFPVFCAKAFAGIGTLPDTISDRSILIKMKRRAPGERVEPFRYRRVVIEADALRERVAAWVAEVMDGLDEDPVVPPELDDRAADGWEPLLALADAAGGDWPGRARAAAVTLSAGRDDEDGDTLGVLLLSHVREVFDGNGDERMSSKALADALVAMGMAPWGDLPGGPLTQRKLGHMLRKYDVIPKTTRLPDGTQLKGYERRQFEDAWDRYCHTETPPPSHIPDFQASHCPIGSTKPFSASFQASQDPTWDGHENLENPHGSGYETVGRSETQEVEENPDNRHDLAGDDVDPDHLFEDSAPPASSGRRISSPTPDSGTAPPLPVSFGDEPRPITGHQSGTLPLRPPNSGPDSPSDEDQERWERYAPDGAS